MKIIEVEPLEREIFCLKRCLLDAASFLFLGAIEIIFKSVKTLYKA